jgi:hypothetical protein
VLNSALEKYWPGQSEPIFVGGNAENQESRGPRVLNGEPKSFAEIRAALEAEYHYEEALDFLKDESCARNKAREMFFQKRRDLM